MHVLTKQSTEIREKEKVTSKLYYLSFIVFEFFPWSAVKFYRSLIQIWFGLLFKLQLFISRNTNESMPLIHSFISMKFMVNFEFASAFRVQPLWFWNILELLRTVNNIFTIITRFLSMNTSWVNKIIWPYNNFSKSIRCSYSKIHDLVVIISFITPTLHSQTLQQQTSESRYFIFCYTQSDKILYAYCSCELLLVSPEI